MYPFYCSLLITIILNALKKAGIVVYLQFACGLQKEVFALHPCTNCTVNKQLEASFKWHKNHFNM